MRRLYRTKVLLGALTLLLAAGLLGGCGSPPEESLESRILNRQGHAGAAAVATSPESSLVAVLLDKGALHAFNKETGQTVCETETLLVFPSASPVGIYYATWDDEDPEKFVIRLLVGDGTSKAVGELPKDAWSIVSNPSGSKLVIQNRGDTCWLMDTSTGETERLVTERDPLWVTWLDDHVLLIGDRDSTYKATLDGGRLANSERWENDNDAFRPSVDHGSGRIAYLRSRMGLSSFFETLKGAPASSTRANELVVADVQTGDVIECLGVPDHVDPFDHSSQLQWKDATHLLLVTNPGGSKAEVWEIEVP